MIHGDKNQADRNRAVEKFKTGEINILVATDVAARGLDIKGVNYVLNYEFPLVYCAPPRPAHPPFRTLSRSRLAKPTWPILLGRTRPCAFVRLGVPAAW